MEENIDVCDFLPELDKKDEDNAPHFDSENKGEKTEDQEAGDRKKRAEILKGFLKPFRLLTQLSPLNRMTILFGIFVSLAISGCSAKRALSKNHFIKNLLRLTMLDEWLSKMILASEIVVLNTIPYESRVHTYRYLPRIGENE